MLMIVTCLTLLSRIPYEAEGLRTCVPHTVFEINGKLCKCNNEGLWIESSCTLIERRHICKPGQIVWQGCNQCICQENGELSCVDGGCHTTSSEVPVLDTAYIRTVSPWCTPFRSYYVNCNICVCPATGRMSDAHCASDPSCSLLTQPSISDLTKKMLCLPKVMYLFPCLHCLCPDDGFFILSACLETCGREQIEYARRCIPKTFYRKDCNVCKCPENSIPDDNLCTKVICNKTTNIQYLQVLRSKSFKCYPQKFLAPRCLYCDCNNKGMLDERACLERQCVPDYKYDVVRTTCSPGEAVPICMECLCLKNGQTFDKYCSRTCSYESKLNVLEDVIIDSARDSGMIDLNAIKLPEKDTCEPNLIYIDQGRFCICPENGNTKFNLCTTLKEASHANHPATVTNKVNIDFNITCEPSTFVEFDCNTCFCSKKGKIDPKWCTYDDCEAKKIIQDSYSISKFPEPEINETCNPGSISKVECNFCICPDNGAVKDLVCTKNDCGISVTPGSFDKFICEPLAYYEVDCNVCFCPKDGMKNLAKCTKNHCERGFLRSDVCVPGQLFTDECNVCICPPNGNKLEKACTNHTCSDTAPWKKIFQLSESLLGNQVAEDATRNLELCFPGEEFTIGCKLCVCPDMGLRVYAACSPMLCEDDQQLPEKPVPELGGMNRHLPRFIKTRKNIGDDAVSAEVVIKDCDEPERPSVRSNKKQDNQIIKRKGKRVDSIEEEISKDEAKKLKDSKKKKDSDELGDDCMIVNMTDSAERKECSPGSMYINRCKQCICPYMGSLSFFCRPLPKGVYCEQPFPNFNFLPMGRRVPRVNKTITNTTAVKVKKKYKAIRIKHKHTKYHCERPGKIMDECFICDCEKGVVIEEHCFKSDADICEEAKPSFLKNDHKVELN